MGHEQQARAVQAPLEPRGGAVHADAAPMASPVFDGLGGGDPQAIFAALAHFTDGQSSTQSPVTTGAQAQRNADPNARAAADTQKLLQYIRAQARVMAKKPMMIDKESMFYQRMSQHYLKDYLANPNPQTGQAAVDKTGAQFDPAKADPNDYWEGNVGEWNAHAVPPGVKLLLGDGAPERMGAATDALSKENRAHLPYLDVPQLIGNANTDTGKDADVFGGGKNISQLMHWATGVRYADKDPTVMRDLFLAYENYHLEGWDNFGQDSINDLISEDAGRIMGRQLQGGQLNEKNLQGKLNDGFNESRAWVGSLIKMRQGQLDKMITSPTAPVSNMWWSKKPEDQYKEWGETSFQQDLLAGKSVEDLKKDPRTKHLAEIYSLIYYSDDWQKQNGKIKHSNFTESMMEGKYDKVFEKSVKNEELTGREKVDAYLDAKAPWVPGFARPLIERLAKDKLGGGDAPAKPAPERDSKQE